MRKLFITPFKKCTGSWKSSRKAEKAIKIDIIYCDENISLINQKNVFY